MTISINLGTIKNRKEVISIAEAVGFSKPEHINTKNYVVNHENVLGLRLQIHGPSIHYGVKGIETEIEFDDTSLPSDDVEMKCKELRKSDRLDDMIFLMRPESINVLKQLYKEVPDLIYSPSFEQAVINRYKAPRSSLSQYLRDLKNFDLS